jgi:serine/threonine-protein kinase RsbW
MEIRMALHLPRDAASVPVTRQVLNGCLETLGVTPDTRADIALALSEACANVIQHAGPGKGYEVQVSVRNPRCAIDPLGCGRLARTDHSLDQDQPRCAHWPRLSRARVLTTPADPRVMRAREPGISLPNAMDPWKTKECGGRTGSDGRSNSFF